MTGGANGYLVKPVSFDGFVEVIRQVSDYWLTLNIGPSKENIKPSCCGT